MNKTVTINISGIIFHIEELAYDKLSKYLGTIKGVFSKTDGGNEIMADIEARIAEMLQSKTNAVKQVVLMADVDSVIDTMGRPEQFVDAADQSSAEEEETNSTSPNEKIKRRMFRDPDHKAVGGVCSGIAAYFDIDIIWIRLAMFLLVFFGGVSLWVYLIMWIVIPEAKTTADKLSMRGEKVDINNISRSVKEEAEQFKKRAEKYGNDIKNNSEGFRNDSKNFFDKLGDFLREFFFLFGRVFGRVIGLVLLIFGVFFMFSLIAGIFGFSVAGTNAEFNDWVNLIFLERNHYTLGMFGMILFFGIPILGIIYGGVKLLFKIKYRNRWMNLSLGLVWLIGLSIMIYIGVTTGKEFSDAGKIKDQVAFVQKDTLYLTIDRDSDLKNQWQINEDHRSKMRHRKNHTVVVSGDGGSYYIGKKGNESRIFGKAELNIVQASGDQIEMYIIKKARGEDRKAATERAKAIDYKFLQKDSLITFDELFMVAANEKFRVQEVQILLKIPRGKVIFLDRNMYPFINDIENTTNTWDGEMVNRRWVMTKDGLSCIDCEGLDKDNFDEEHFPTPPVPPGPPSPPNSDVNVDLKDANVKIDKDGINIKSKEANVNIDNKGIHIDTKGNKGEK
jgi:phage shock protein PspC (stress-responsive transcriptional regulator)